MPNDGASEERDLIYIPDEDGNEEAFEVLFTFEVDESDHKYMLVVPADDELDDEADLDDESETEVLAFRYEEDENGEITLYLIEDEKEWDIVEETFNTLMDEMEAEELGERE